MELKNILLQNYPNVFLDNKYLDEYCKLITNNLKTKVEAFKTQNHHFIPVNVYKILNNLTDRRDSERLANLDPNNFKVSLLYKDHVLAHYYLSMCTTDRISYANAIALYRVLGNSNYIKDPNYSEERTILENLDKWQQVYQDMMKKRSELYTGRKGKPNTETHKQQISIKNKGNIYVRKLQENGIYIVKKAKTKEEFQRYISEGWEKGSYPPESLKNHKGDCSVAEQQSKRKTGSIYINNGKENKIIYRENFDKLDNYYQNGWVKGKIITSKAMFDYVYNRPSYKAVSNGNIEKHIKVSEVEDFLKNNPEFILKGKKKRKDNE